MKKCKLFKRITAVAAVAAVAAMTVSATVTGFISRPIKADALDGGIMAKSVIMTGVGEIPVIGKLISKPLEPILSELFGIPSTGDIINKLSEISIKIDTLSEKIDEETQKILSELSKDYYNSFNENLTKLEVSVSSKYKMLKAIEISDISDNLKAFKTAELLKFDYESLDNFAVVAETLKSYVNGTQASLETKEKLYTFAYNSKCKDSIIGGEAALKATEYVNTVNEIIADAYKLINLSLGEKLYVHNNMDEINKEAETNASLKRAIEKSDTDYEDKTNAIYWESLLEDENGNGYIKDYNDTFSLENSESTVSQYNKMVEDNWFTYIRSAKVESGVWKLDLVKLNKNMSVVTPEECGFIRDPNKGDRYGYMAKNVTNKLNGKINSALTKDEITKLCKLLSTNEVFCKDENGNNINLAASFRQYGFIMDKDYSTGTEKAIFATNSSYDTKNVDTSMERYWEVTSNFAGYDAAGMNKTLNIQYYHYKEHRGCYPKETGDKTHYDLIYLTKA